MGLLSWWKGRRSGGSAAAVAAASTHGAVEVRRQAADAAVFEFGSAAESGAAVTLAGYCPISDDLEPCRWELVPASGEGAPQFRIVF
ncbi:hypothetical protein GUJ93_ZPchr0010g9551 [Zizania palustris]|uniref:Allyl alcohol dehydrogenase-like protein n=1 Tax=Zizania palustris TaxID=103762 RepID=A0A8J5WBS2_ZIZPA|nr:hypothetical protein GUJ93_ZPchr0010g9551 [Zizania palustris]